MQLWHIDDVPVGLILATERGRVLQANQTMCDLLGLELQSLTSRTMDQVFTPAARLLYHSYLLPLLKLHGELAELSLSVQTSANVRLDVLIKARYQAAQGHEDGLIQFVFFPWRERRRLEEQLLSAKRAAEQVPGMLFELRRDGSGNWRMPYASDQLRQMHGIPPMSVVDDADLWWRSIHPEDRGLVADGLAASARDLQPWRGEYRVLMRGQESWRETHASPQAQPDGAMLWHGYTADVTERKQLQAQVTERVAAERLNQARHEFLARVSHELRTPLNGILGFAQLLLLPEVGVHTPVHRDRVQRIEQAGRALLRLVDDVLDITRIQAGGLRLHFSSVSVAEVIDEAVQWLLPQAQAQQVALAVRDGEAPEWVTADRYRLLQCLTNLLSNAIKYGGRGHEVVVRWHRSDAQLVLEVLDQGPGFTDAQLDALFEPFNRLGAERSDVQGAGLGLAITRGLIEMMSGQLHVSNRPGGGACFRVSLPLASSGSAPHRHAPPSLAGQACRLTEVPPSRELVLYVEDNDVNALVMASMMELRPEWELVRATTGREALEWLQRHTPSLLLLDMHLPDAHGPGLLQEIRTSPAMSHVPAIAVSADALAESIHHAMVHGFQAYWTKPLDLGQVLPQLDEWLLRVRASRQNVAG